MGADGGVPQSGTPWPANAERRYDRDEPNELGIIRNVGYGLRDRSVPMLYFDVHTLRGGSLQCFFQPEADALIVAFEVGNITQLNGMACVVQTTDGLMKVIGPAKL